MNQMNKTLDPQTLSSMQAEDMWFSHNGIRYIGKATKHWTLFCREQDEAKRTPNTKESTLKLVRHIVDDKQEFIPITFEIPAVELVSINKGYFNSKSLNVLVLEMPEPYVCMFAKTVLVKGYPVLVIKQHQYMGALMGVRVSSKPKDVHVITFPSNNDMDIPDVI